MKLGDQEYFNKLKVTLAPYPPEVRQRAVRAATKRVAKHYGMQSRYDGKGNPREGFPAAGPTAERPHLPRPLPATWGERMSYVWDRQARNKVKAQRKARKASRARRANTGPSKKFFVPRTDV